MLRNIKVKNTLDYVSTWQDWFTRHSNVEKCFEESRASQSTTGPEIERLRQREAELQQEVRQQKNAKARSDALFWRNRTKLEPRESRTSEDQQIIRDLRSEIVQLKVSALPLKAHQKSWSKDWKSKRWHSKSSKRSTDNTRLTELLRRSVFQLDSRCLCWRQCCYINIIGQQIYGTSYPSRTTSREWPRAVSTEREYNAEVSFQLCCSSEYHHKRESRKHSSGSAKFFISDDFFTTGKKYRGYSDSSSLWRT